MTLIYVDKKMTQKDFFAELDPLSRLRNVELQKPMMPQLYRKDRERMDDSFVEACQTKENGDEQLRKDMHLMSQMIEGTREEMRQRDCSHEKEMQLLMQKITELSACLTDKKPETSYVESKVLPDKTELRKLPEPETDKKKGQSDRTVHWKDNEIAEKKTDNSERIRKDQIIIKPSTFSWCAERKSEIEQTNKASQIDSSENKTAKTEQNKKSQFIMKPAIFAGSTSWIDYRSHFDMCAELNNWTNQQKGLYLGVSLRGLAQGVLGNLPVKDQRDSEILSKALSERFSPESQTELYRAQLKEREWKHGENVAEFGQRILRLTSLSYPGADPSLINVLAMGYFLDSIFDADMRLKIQQTRPKDLNEAVKVAVELEAFDREKNKEEG